MKVEVLYIANCPNHRPVVDRVRDELRAAGIAAVIMEVEVHSTRDAESQQFLGSPTVRIDGLDVEPEARAAQHFGLGCRSYAEQGNRTGMPSTDLIRSALHEQPASPLPTASPGVDLSE